MCLAKGLAGRHCLKCDDCSLDPLPAATSLRSAELSSLGHGVSVLLKYGKFIMVFLLC